MTKEKAVKYLEEQGLGWIANVFATRSCNGQSAKILKSIAFLVEHDCTVTSLSFTMPDEKLVLNGKVVTPKELVEEARKLAVQVMKKFIQNTKKEWNIT